MKKKIEIIPLEVIQSEHGVRRRCRITKAGRGTDLELWWEYPPEIEQPDASNCDSYILAALMPAMKMGADVRIRGSVSGDLLANLTEFQYAWHKWRPDVYKMIAIQADGLIHMEPANDAALVAFSGGVDAFFTLYRHLKKLDETVTQDIAAAVMIHGFDIPLAKKKDFTQAKQGVEKVLADTSVKLIVARTNIAEQAKMNWVDYHGTALASVLVGVQSIAGTALIGSTEPYSSLILPWGSNPVTDPMMSSASFQIRHDGAGFTRLEKLKILSEWKAAMDHLRICWSGARKDRNCGVCEKCLSTRLLLLVAGVENPGCFDTPLTDQCFKSLALANDDVRHNWTEILEMLRASEKGAQYVREVERVLKRPPVRFGRILPLGSRRRAGVLGLLGRNSQEHS